MDPAESLGVPHRTLANGAQKKVPSATDVIQLPNGGGWLDAIQWSRVVDSEAAFRHERRVDDLAAYEARHIEMREQN